MLDFKTFIEQEEEDKDILNTLSKIPKSHSDLVKGYRIEFQGKNTLKGDRDNVGYVRNDPKEIVVAAPWRYSREQCFLHEVAHRVWSKLSEQLKNQWMRLVKNTKQRMPQTDALNQNPEEVFCQSYGTFYAKHKLTTFNNPAWMLFIKNLPQ